MAVELLFLTTLSAIRKRPASRLPENVVTPVSVLISTMLLVPSVISKFTLAPPLKVKFPCPLVSKLSGTFRSVPSVPIVFVLSILILAACVPISTLVVDESTLKNGLTFAPVASTCSLLTSIPSVPIVPIAVPATVIPMLSALCL